MASREFLPKLLLASFYTRFSSKARAILLESITHIVLKRLHGDFVHKLFNLEYDAYKQATKDKANL